MLEKWNVEKKLKFVKEDVIEGLDNEVIIYYYIFYGYVPPMLIPF